MFAFTDLPLLPIIGLVVCAVLIVRLAIGPGRRARFDAAVVRRWQRLRAGAARLVRQRRLRTQAEREADAAIQRARRTGARAVERDGNVLRPRSFQAPPRGEPRDDDDDRPGPGDGAGGHDGRGGRTLH
jgi:hypothetical protein